MDLHIIDLSIIATYFILVALVGFVIKKKASKQLDSYFLAYRSIPW